MLIEQKFLLAAPREEVAGFFVDIDQVAACIPGVEDVEETAPGQYAAVLAMRLGPIRAAFRGSLVLDAKDAPQRLVATGEGRDRATGTVAKVTFTADLAEAGPAQTEVTAVADLSLRGRMAQFGTGVVRAAAGEMVSEFAARANQRFTAPAPVGPAPVGPAAVGFPQPQGAEARTVQDGPASEQPGAAPRRSRGLLRVVLRGLTEALLHRVRQWWAGRRRPAGDGASR